MAMRNLRHFLMLRRLISRRPSAGAMYRSYDSQPTGARNRSGESVHESSHGREEDFCSESDAEHDAGGDETHSAGSGDADPTSGGTRFSGNFSYERQPERDGKPASRRFSANLEYDGESSRAPARIFTLRRLFTFAAGYLGLRAYHLRATIMKAIQEWLRQRRE